MPWRLQADSDDTGHDQRVLLDDGRECGVVDDGRECGVCINDVIVASRIDNERAIDVNSDSSFSFSIIIIYE